MAQKAMDGLFLHFLQDIYDAERQISKALPKLAKTTTSDELKALFTKHREETLGQIERPQHVFEAVGKRACGVTCEAINGLIEEAEEVVEEFEQGPARDSGLLACAQAIEHYEIARYGALLAWAKAQAKGDAVKLLQETLDAEKRTDGLQNDVANKTLNAASAKAA